MNFDTILSHIVEKNIPCYFLSPHLDDAVLSAGALIRFLAKKTQITIITVFTEPQKPYTLSGKMFAKYCGYADPALLYVDRKKEDLLVCQKLGVKAVHLGFVEGLFRKKPVSKLVAMAGNVLPELMHVYPTYKFHISKGVISRKDDALFESLLAELSQLIPSARPHAVFAPLAVGNHVDHQVVRNAVMQKYSDAILWEDFPYALHSPLDESYIKKHLLVKNVFEQELESKRQDILGYRTQIQAMFGEKEIMLRPEVFYIKDGVSF